MFNYTWNNRNVRSWKSWLRHLRRIPSNFVTKVSNSPKRIRSKTTASFYIGYCDDPDGVESDYEIVEGCNLHQHHTFYENSGDVTNISFNENESKNGESFKAYMNISQLERRSSDIDGLRSSALENIDKIIKTAL